MTVCFSFYLPKNVMFPNTICTGALWGKTNFSYRLVV